MISSTELTQVYGEEMSRQLAVLEALRQLTPDVEAQRVLDSHMAPLRHERDWARARLRERTGEDLVGDLSLQVRVERARLLREAEGRRVDAAGVIRQLGAEMRNLIEYVEVWRKTKQAQVRDDLGVDYPEAVRLVAEVRQFIRNHPHPSESLETRVVRVERMLGGPR